jgi:hypothetical protein
MFLHMYTDASASLNEIPTHLSPMYIRSTVAVTVPGIVGRKMTYNEDNPLLL